MADLKPERWKVAFDLGSVKYTCTVIALTRDLAIALGTRKMLKIYGLEPRAVTCVKLKEQTIDV